MYIPEKQSASASARVHKEDGGDVIVMSWIIILFVSPKQETLISGEFVSGKSGIKDPPPCFSVRKGD
jgi:hypothetical protein